MKCRKRLLSLFLSLAVMLTMCVTTAAAVDADGSATTITVETVKQADKVGDEVSLNVSIANNPGFVAFDFTIQYDKEKLELQGIEKGSFEGSPVGNTATGKVNFIGDVQQECTGDGRLFILKFKVKADCSSGTNVTLETTTFKNASNVMINASVVPGGISETSTGGSSTGGSTTGGSTTGGSTTGGSTTGGSTTGGSTTGGSTTGGSTTGGSTTGGSTTGGSTTGGSTTGGSTTGGSTTGGSTTGGSTTGAVKVTDIAVGVEKYTVIGQTVTVTSQNACKLGYLKDGKYVAIPAAVNADGSYSFEVPEGITDVVLVIKGDINGDGEIKGSDITQLKAGCLGKLKTPLTELQIFAGDIVSDGEIKGSDITQLKAAFLGKIELSW